MDLARARLVGQRLIAPQFERPADVVSGLLAVQAQDLRGGHWGVALRTADATEADVERAIAARAIVRTWPMRGTLHFVAAADVRWMLRLLAPRVIVRAAGRHRELGLDAKTFTRSRDVVERALAGGAQRTRSELYAILARARIAPTGQRGIHILGRLAMEGVLCSGAHRGKQPTFVLLDEWVPAAPALDRDEALGAVARRYFLGHGPATVHDLAWWTGLPIGEARRALEIARPHLVEPIAGYWSGPLVASRTRAAPIVHLLPPWDEYTVGYRDRSAMLDPADAVRGKNGIFSPVIALDGRIAGLWKRRVTAGKVAIATELFAPATIAVRRALSRTAERYGSFLGLEASLG